MDHQRLTELLSDNALTYDTLSEYAREVAEQTLAYRKGLGRFKLGQPALDLGYLDQRVRLLESHGELYSHGQ